MPTNVIVADYLHERQDRNYEAQLDEFNFIMQCLRRYHPDPIESLLEIGIGTGWFQVRCRQQGIACRGLEIDPDLIACAHQLAHSQGITLDLDCNSLERASLGLDRYDAIVADCTFEHVKDWREWLGKVYRALKPGGVFFFVSSNKFSPTSGEYSPIPLYGWYPDRVRYWLRRRIQGPAIMEWGIDFNQFTHPQLRRVFRQLGFARIYDHVEVLDPDHLTHPTRTKRLAIRALQTIPGLKAIALTFVETTRFVCVK
jgi:2-polyprenyl-3-methyl-5-hydroxy-6-metoxy-1,4-benzoquinol methylase